MTPRQMDIVVPAFYAAMAIAGVLWRWLAGLPLDTRLWWGPGQGTEALVVGASAAGAVLLVTELILRKGGWVDFLERTFRDALGRVTIQRALWLALLSSLAEEIFFRGAFQPTLGLTASAVVFGLLHTGPDRRFLVWTSFALAMGFVLGKLAVTTGGVLAPVVTHFLVNFHNLLFTPDRVIPPAWMRSQWSR